MMNENEDFMGVSVAFNYFMTLREYDERIETCNNKIAYERQTYENKKNLSKPLRILMAILIYFGVVGILTIIVSTGIFGPGAELDSGDAAYLRVGSVCIVLLIIWMVFYVIKKMRAKKYLSDVALPRINNYQKQLGIAKQEKTAYKTQENKCLAMIPENYRDIYCVAYVYKVMSEGRADSLKESLNLYEEYLHRLRMENQMERLIEYQDEILSAAEDIYNELSDISGEVSSINSKMY